jgi:ABC-type transport system substrate-binding protein
LASGPSSDSYNKPRPAIIFIYRSMPYCDTGKGEVGMRLHRSRSNGIWIIAILLAMGLLLPSSFLITNGVEGRSVGTAPGAPGRSSELGQSSIDYLANGFSLDIYYNNGNVNRQKACEILKSNLESLNPGKIFINVHGVNFATYLNMKMNGQLPLVFDAWAADYADPIDFVVPFLTSSGPGMKDLGYSNSTLDAMVAQAGSDMNPVTRAAKYENISMAAYENALYLWLCQRTSFTAMRSWVQGFEYNPMSSMAPPLMYYQLSKSPGANNPNTLIVGEPLGDPDYFDPARDWETTGQEVIQNVYETLVTYQKGDASAFVPVLCTELPSVAGGGITDGGRSYTFHIRPNVMFQDGSNFTAYDVKFSIERLLRLNYLMGPAWMIGELLIPNYYSYGAGTFDSGGNLVGGIQNDLALAAAMWVKDPLTIQFNLTAANPAFFSVLSATGGSIVSLENVQDNVGSGIFSKSAYDWVNAHPIGTGAYALIESVSNSYTAMERFDGYWQGSAPIRYILLNQIATPETRALQLINGDLDVALIPRSLQSSLFGQGLSLGNYTAWSLDTIGFNQDFDKTGQPATDVPSTFFRDLRIRQAFVHAFDFPSLNATVGYGGFFQPNGIIPRGMFGYSPAVPTFALNLTLSASLLQGNGLPSPPQNLMGFAGNGLATLSWSPPFTNGGSPIDYYAVYKNGTEVLQTALLTAVVSNLTNGRSYLFEVRAHNSVGLGNASMSVLVTPSGPPTAPLDLVALPGNGRAELTWEAPANDGGLSIDRYLIFRNGSEVSNVTTLNVTVNGLQNGISYSFTVAAHNARGPGPVSSTAVVVPRTVPTSPTNLQLTPGDSQIALSWQAPSDNGGASVDYYVVYKDGTDVFHANSTAATVTGLANGLSYNFTVAAHNAAGTGLRSPSQSAAPRTVPGTPTGLRVTVGSGLATLEWTKPSSDGGAAISHYIVYQDGVGILLVNGTSETVNGLKNGHTYEFTVAAYNAAGAGPKAVAVSATPNENILIYIIIGIVVILIVIMAVVLVMRSRKGKRV